MPGIRICMLAVVLSFVAPGPEISYQDRVVAAVNKCPVTGRDVSIELLVGALNGDEALARVIRERKGKISHDLPGMISNRLLDTIIQRTLIMGEIQRSRRFRPMLDEGAVRDQVNAWESGLEQNGSLASFARWLGVERSEFERHVRTNMLIERYVTQEFEVLRSTGKKSRDLYNKWITILWNRSDVIIF